MKNIHVLLAGESYLSLNCSYRDSAIGTEVRKPYWTYTKDWKHYMSVTDASVRPHNIYITNDEEIKDGYFLDLTHNIVMKAVFYPSSDKNCKKIILTTDQDLIKDGVQAISDEFLEWFVKNPSYEEVEVRKQGTKVKHNQWGFTWRYFINIPKEEPKQENTADYIDRHIVQAMVEVVKQNLYSEEEVQVKLYECLGHFAQKHNIIINGSEIDQWFEQFKKK